MRRRTDLLAFRPIGSLRLASEEGDEGGAEGAVVEVAERARRRCAIAVERIAFTIELISGWSLARKGNQSEAGSISVAPAPKPPPARTVDRMGSRAYWSAST
jgi:hypothetical protein